jgi:hypothetical protein
VFSKLVSLVVESIENGGQLDKGQGCRFASEHTAFGYFPKRLTHFPGEFRPACNTLAFSVVICAPQD